MNFLINLCLTYKTPSATREKIQAILEKVGDARERSGDEYCLTDAGLTGSETTCKEAAGDFCSAISGVEKPSRAFRHCRSDCIGSCMAGNECSFDLDEFNNSDNAEGSG